AVLPEAPHVVATLICAALVFVKVPETKAAEPQGSAERKQSVGYGVVLKDRTFMCLIGLTFLVVVLFQQAATVLTGARHPLFIEAAAT
ncbi:hypothetical protein ABT113_45770, partial [Streptomyces mirabilis]